MVAVDEIHGLTPLTNSVAERLHELPSPRSAPSRLIRFMFPTRLHPVLRYCSNQSTLTEPNPRQPLHKEMQYGRARLQWPPVQPSSPDLFRQGTTITTPHHRRSTRLPSTSLPAIAGVEGTGRGGTKPFSPHWAVELRPCIPFRELFQRTMKPSDPCVVSVFASSQ